MTKNIIDNQKEVQILLESLMGDRLRIDSIRKQEVKGNKTKYTIIVQDTAIPEKAGPIKKVITEKNSNDKKKVVIQKNVTQINDKNPIPPAKPPMAEIFKVG